MNNSNLIGVSDKQISEIIEFHKGGSAPVLFEWYRISGVNQDDFVAALIARLCVLEARKHISGGA